MKRDSFIFYRSFYEAIDLLEPKDQLVLYKAICEYSLNFREIELTHIQEFGFTGIKPLLDANITRYKNGCKPKREQTESENETNNKQSESKSRTNVNYNVNNTLDNNNLNNNVNNTLENKNELNNYLFNRKVDIYDEY